MVERGRDWGWRTLFSSSCNGTNLTMKTSPLWPHLNRICPQISISKYHHMRNRTLPCEFGTHKHPVHCAFLRNWAVLYDCLNRQQKCGRRDTTRLGHKNTKNFLLAVLGCSLLKSRAMRSQAACREFLHKCSRDGQPAHRSLLMMSVLSSQVAPKMFQLIPCNTEINHLSQAMPKL